MNLVAVGACFPPTEMLLAPDSFRSFTDARYSGLDTPCRAGEESRRKEEREVFGVSTKLRSSSLPYRSGDEGFALSRGSCVDPAIDEVREGYVALGRSRKSARSEWDEECTRDG